MLVDILAREALKEVIAGHLKSEADDDVRQEAAKTYNERALAGHWRYRDQVLSASEVCGAGLFRQNLVNVKRKSDMSLAERGEFGLYIQFALTLPIVPASLAASLGHSLGPIRPPMNLRFRDILVD